MARVLGVTAVIAILCSASLAAAQEGWTDQPGGGAAAEEGAGWGQPADTGQPAAQPEGGAGWSGSPQTNDTENPTGGGTAGWGQPAPSGGNAAPAPAAAAPAPTTTTPVTTPATTTETGPVGAQFRLAHRVALGAHNHMSGAFLAAHDGLTEDQHSNTPWLNLSFVYTLNSALALDIFFGFTVGRVSYATDEDGLIGGHYDGDGVTSFELAFGPRLLITLSEGDHARLYTGVGLALLIGVLNGSRGDEDDGVCPGMNCGGWDAYGFALALPLGVQYRFQSVPNLAFSAEVSFHMVYQSIGRRYEDDPGDSVDIVSQADYSHLVVGLGNPREEGASSFVDYLTFLTMGFHWLI